MKGDVWSQMAEMIAADTTSMGMSPKARANRRKQTGKSRMNEGIVEQDIRGCRHKDDGVECGGPIHAIIPVVIWGRRAWRGFCADHVAENNKELHGE